ncbi:substrate-binding domain-containing protein [Lacrimispora saccharolytica]|uniref:Periplasmic binding protein/LacI transcriptional regulator n=1 Tax=Lacrimispora saccharolytica (strain ATCC 35040 / DSM 2544 / NRCC 2533 / WM1) TaxID=610130 RepID=D9R955_LACSW|nr:substrate-binding domain-containing protein [Lacrimispora saccharolytica]ADL04030.1 periplasmic binding protein/LacI transcriptional regulator [[Clostridium] saccharolyticum WM1]QRV21671.1 substrate-binding domain-containing protein [Lacrimispora saccharolytica]
MNHIMNENYKIYLITMDKRDQFWMVMDKGAREMASMLGVTYEWDAPLERDVNKQIQIFNNAVAAGADAIMLAASDPLKISGAVEEAKAKGVKIIYVDAPAFEEAIITLATDNYTAGKIAGENMYYELEAIGVTNGSIGIIGVTPENRTTVNREIGFRDYFESFDRYQILETIYTNGDPELAKQATEKYIEDNSNLVGIFSTNEGSTLGMGYAFRDYDTNIIGIGFDITETIQEMIRDNTIQATLVQNPYTMGYLGMAESVAALRGFDTGPKFINTGVTVVNIYTPSRILS